MPEFKYQARGADGKTITGQIDAANEDEAIATLRSQNLVVLSVKKEGGGLSSLMSINIQLGAGRVKTDELVVFTRQLATMVSAGIPLLEALEILTEQATNAAFKNVLTKVVNSVRGGTDLSEALTQHPKAFTRIYVNMIRAGEASGQLDEILDRLAEHMEASAALKREIKAAMTYPIISIGLILVITILLLVFIIPKFKPIFDLIAPPNDPTKSLPLPTAILLKVSNFMQSHFILMALGTTGLVVALMLYIRTDQGRRQFDWCMLKMPVLGSLFHKVAIARFSRTFATLVESGVPIIQALEIVGSTAGNKIIEDAVDRARESIRSGENLAKPMGESKVFPPMVVKMVAVGERSGALEALLKKIAEFYEQQVDAAVKSLTSMIEPLMIMVMGILVGGIVMAVFMPLFKLQDTLSGG